MTTYNKATLKTFFQTNDVPDGNDYANFIDSYVNIVETATQTMAGPLSTTELITSRVSASNLTLTGDTSFNGSITGIGVNKTVTYSLIATSGGLGNISVSYDPSIPVINNTNGLLTYSITDSKFIFDGADVSAKSNINAVGNVTSLGDITASGAVSAKRFLQPVAIISAAGTAQGTAALCSAAFCRLQGVVDGSTTGFRLQANFPGMAQYIRNETAVSANLWPPTGGQINALGANIPFPLAANTPYTVMHFTASAYGVK